MVWKTLSFFSLFFLIAKGGELHQVTVQLNWHPHFEFAGLYMAKELGYYRREGLNVRILPGSENMKHNVAQTLIQGKADFGIAYSGILTQQEGRFKILGALFSHSPLLMVVKNPSIQGLRSLEKSEIFFNSPEKGRSALSLLLKKRIGIKQLHPYDLHAFRKGKHTAIDTFPGNPLVEKLLRSGTNFILIDPATYGYDFYTDFIVTTARNWEKDPLTARRFAMATLEGWRYAMEHIKETAHILHEKYTPGLREDQLRFEADHYRNYIGDLRNSPGMLDPKRLRAMLERYDENGIKMRSRKIETLVDPLFLDHWGLIDEQERWWMARHTLRYSETHWPPFFVHTEKGMEGIVPNLFTLIRRNTGLLLHYETRKSWPDVLHDLRRHRLDMAAATGRTPERERYALFTLPYDRYPYALAVSSTKKGFDFQHLKDFRLAVGKDYTAEKFLRKHFPKLELLTVRNNTEGLKLLHTGKVDGVVDILPVLKYMIAHMNLTDVKILTPFKENFVLRGMIRKDYPIAVKIFNKGLYQISEAERQSIYNRWLPVSLETERYRWTLLPMFVLLVLLSAVGVVSLKMRREIRRRRQAEEEIKQMWKIIDRYVLLSKSAPDGSITYISQAFRELTGYSAEELLGQNFRLLKSEETPEDVQEKLWRTISSGEPWEAHEVKNRRKDGTPYWVETSITPLFDKKGEIREYLEICKDITPYKEMERTASVDPMTGFYNRRAFNLMLLDRLTFYRRHGGFIHFGIYDIDHFKEYNDLYGHEAGDRVIRACCLAVAETFRRENDLHFRMGGEEFVLMSETIRETETVARLLIEAIRKLQIPHRGNPLYGIVTVSLGMIRCQIVKGDTIDINSIYTRADNLMYRAKKKGRNRYCVESISVKECSSLQKIQRS